LVAERLTWRTAAAERENHSGGYGGLTEDELVSLAGRECKRRYRFADALHLLLVPSGVYFELLESSDSLGHLDSHANDGSEHDPRDHE